MSVNERHFRVLETRAGVRWNDDRLGWLMQRLLAPFPPIQATSVPKGNLFSLSGPPGGRVLSRDGAAVAHSSSWPDLVNRMLADLNLAAVEEVAAFAAHAGAVAAGSRVLAFPCPSGGGKTTLTAACLTAGFDYVSDEALCLSLDGGRVIPYPKPLALSPWSLARLAIELEPSPARDGQGETPIAAEELGASVASGELRLAEVVLVERRPGPVELIEERRSQALSALLALSFNHYKRPAETFRILGEVASECRAWRLRYDDPPAAAACLWEAFGT